MNHTKAMMISYFSVYAVLLISSVLEYKLPEFNTETIDSLLSKLLLALIAVTFVFMYLAAKKGIGKKYAVKNTILAVIMTSVAVGFILWPLLVRNEIKKKRLLFERSNRPQTA